MAPLEVTRILSEETLTTSKALMGTGVVTKIAYLHRTESDPVPTVYIVITTPAGHEFLGRLSYDQFRYAFVQVLDARDEITTGHDAG